MKGVGRVKKPAWADWFNPEIAGFPISVYNLKKSV